MNARLAQPLFGVIKYIENKEKFMGGFPVNTLPGFIGLALLVFDYSF